MNIAKNIAKISALSGSLVIVASSTVSAGPMSIAGANIVTPPSQVEHVQWWPGYYGYGWAPGAAVAGTALGLISLGTLGAVSGYPYYGYPYGYYAGYWPYYRHYGYWASNVSLQFKRRGSPQRSPMLQNRARL